MSYVSQRTVTSAAQPNDALDGYLYVDGRVEYALTDALSAFASVQNLTNSSIFVFERYVERSAFGALGLRLKF
jgi:outer membrane receptor for ferrienterochelin and colicin